MESLELLAREDEFKKLNQQLEKKTESLMKQIEQAMQKKDIFSEFAPSLTLSPNHIRKKHSCNTYIPLTTQDTLQTKQKNKIIHNPEYHRNKNKIENRSNNNEQFENNIIVSDKFDTKFENGSRNIGKFKNKLNSAGDKFENGTDDASYSIISSEENSLEQNRSRIVCDCCINNSQSQEKEFIYAFVSINVKNKVLPQSFLKDSPTVESVCKFLSSKVKLMQEQIDKLQGTLDKKANQCGSHMKHLAELESERLSLMNQSNNMKASTADMRAKFQAVQLRLEEKEKLYLEQRSLADKLSCEMKHLRSKNHSLEAKCATQEQTVEHLSHQLETVRRAEKDFRNSTRSLSASHQSAISKLESQLKAQVHRIEKQMALIDNLRRQTVILSTEAAVKRLERDYCSYLEQDF